VRYFDHNATHPVSAAARTAWIDAVERFPANPSSPHRLGARADAALRGAREQLAGWLGCSPFDLVWTSGATESNNAVLHQLAQSGDGDVWLSGIEHPCVLAAARRWLPGRHRFIPVTREGVVEWDWLTEAVRRNPPQAIAVMAANNETGVQQPWEAIRELARRHGVAFFCDAAQWLGRLPAQGLGGCDFVTGCAHKFGGPPGVGFLKCPPGFQPLIVGGPQEDGRRAGTENVPGVLSMIAALAEREAATARGEGVLRGAWRDAFIADLQRALPAVVVVGQAAPRLWNTVAVLMPAAADCRRRWVVKLDKLGFAVSTGSACASGKEQPSHVLAAMGFRAEESDRMLRFSAGWETGPEDWSQLLEAIRLTARELLPLDGDSLDPSGTRAASAGRMRT